MQDSFCYILVCRFTETFRSISLCHLPFVQEKVLCCCVAWTKKCEAELFCAALRAVGVYLRFLRSLNIWHRWRCHCTNPSLIIIIRNRLPGFQSPCHYWSSTSGSSKSQGVVVMLLLVLQISLKTQTDDLHSLPPPKPPGRSTPKSIPPSRGASQRLHFTIHPL